MESLSSYSEAMITRGSQSFALAARLFDRQTRVRAMLLYAWCRHCDDEIDGQELGSTPRQPEQALQERRLETLFLRTRSALAGERQHEAAFRSFQCVMEQCAIPPRYPLELLEGLAMDVRGTRYRTLDDTLRYCYHVAGTVGAMMARTMGVSDNPTLLRGIHLGIGLQLTNIARDVMDDARVGRLYLPSDWLAEAGISPAPADVLRHPEATARVTNRLLSAADPYYASARQGIACLPYRSAWAVNTAARVYAKVGTLVRQRGERAWSTRASVSRGSKLSTLIWAGAEVGWLKLFRRHAHSAPPAGLWDPAAAPDTAYPSKR